MNAFKTALQAALKAEPVDLFEFTGVESDILATLIDIVRATNRLADAVAAGRETEAERIARQIRAEQHIEGLIEHIAQTNPSAIDAMIASQS